MSHDRRAVTVGNEAPFWPSSAPRYDDVIDDFPSDHHDHARLRLSQVSIRGPPKPGHPDCQLRGPQRPAKAESGTKWGRLCREHRRIRCPGEARVPALEVSAEACTGQGRVTAQSTSREADRHGPFRHLPPHPPPHGEASVPDSAPALYRSRRVRRPPQAPLPFPPRASSFPRIGGRARRISPRRRPHLPARPRESAVCTGSSPPGPWQAPEGIKIAVAN